MAIDEEALSVITGNSSFCNSDKLMIRRIVEAYEQAKTQVMRVIHVDDLGKATCVPSHKTICNQQKRKVN